MSDETPVLEAPYPYIGGKASVAPLVWSRFGTVDSYVEPFFGGGAVLMGRPEPVTGLEVVNDVFGFIPNFWRAVQKDPGGVAAYAQYPVYEIDLHARESWLVGVKKDLVARLEGDPDYYDVKAAGWWVWGQCLYIGSGWCAGWGAWVVERGDDGFNRLVKRDKTKGNGIQRKRVELSDSGKGVVRPRFQKSGTVAAWMRRLSDRFRNVRVCCGDWSRVCGTISTTYVGTTGVFLDPPYGAPERDGTCYATGTTSSAVISREDARAAREARDWAVTRGSDPRFRIALCGYEGEHDMPDSWECVPWKANGGFGNQSKKHDNPNKRRERIWFSPHCVRQDRQRTLFDLVKGDES